MNYKVCIIGAGKGSRMEHFTKILNKALLPVHGKPAIAHIVESYDPELEIVFAIGYLGDQIKAYLEAAYPKRKFTWIEIENYAGPGSGPGLTLLACKEHLQCPFVLANVDAMTAGKIPEPNEDWFGVAEVDDTERFCSVKVDETNTIIRIDDKIKTNNKYAFTGIAGIFNYEIFWNALEGNDTLIAGERQVSNGFGALQKNGMKIRVLNWFDTGVPDAYKETCKKFPK